MARKTGQFQFPGPQISQGDLDYLDVGQGPKTRENTVCHSPPESSANISTALGLCRLTGGDLCSSGAAGCCVRACAESGGGELCMACRVSSSSLLSSIGSPSTSDNATSSSSSSSAISSPSRSSASS